MELTRIDHVSLNLRDRPAALRWYSQMLGLSVGRLTDAPEEPVFLGPDGAQLGIFGGAGPAGLHHVALQTDADGQDAVLERLRAVKARYSIEHRSDHRSVYFADPEGNRFEVIAQAR